MSNPTKLLDKAFEEALREAVTLDRQGIAPDVSDDLFVGRVPSNEELVKACRDFYKDKQTVIDTAVQGALDFLDTPQGVALVKTLEASFESPDLNPLSVELANEILSSGEFGLTASSNLWGFGIGVSAGASAFVGVLAGADIVFEVQDKADVHPRMWVGGSLKSGLSISAGLELSFWVDKPTTGAIAGWLLDLYIPTIVIGYFIRFMYINQRESGATDFTFSGVSLQFPLGIGFPLRRKKEDNPKLVAPFAAKQTAWDKSKRATFDVVNKATGVSTIAVQEVATLTATLKNTSGNNMNLSAGATMAIGMPSYFTPDDVLKMSISYPGWTFTNDGSKLTLTLSAGSTWKAGEVFSFAITNVKSSNTPPLNQQSYPGTITLNMNDTSFSTPIVDAVSFALVWANSEATLDWSVILNPNDFKLNENASGSIVAYAQPGNAVVALTTATSISTGDVWILGYVFNYNTAIPNQVVPQVCAAWLKQNAVAKGNNVFYGNEVSESGDKSTCYYASLPSTGDSITIKVTFSSS